MASFSLNQQIFLSKCRLVAEPVDNKLKEILNLVESQHLSSLPLGEVLKRAKEHHVVFWQSLPKLWHEIDRYIRHLKSMLQPYHIQMDHGADMYYRQSIWSTFLNRISLQPDLISGSACQGVTILNLLVEVIIDTVFSLIPYVESEPDLGRGGVDPYRSNPDPVRDRYFDAREDTGYERNSRHESKREAREEADRRSAYSYEPVPTPREPIMIRLGGKQEKTHRSRRHSDRDRESTRSYASYNDNDDDDDEEQEDAESTVSSERDDEGDRRSRRSKRYA